MSGSPEAVMQQLLSDIHTLQLASLTPDGLPNISYAPYVRDENGHYFIFISQLASHTQDLLSNPVVSAMITEDEQQSRQIFARTRLIYHCNVEQVEPSDQHYQPILEEFEISFGNVIQVLRGLPDFILFKLVPTSGRFVMGFGQAYELSGENLHDLNHIQ